MSSPQAQKPIIVLAPGSYVRPPFYDNLLAPLRAAGIDIHVLSHETVGRRPGPAPTMYDDASNIAAEVRAHVEQGRDVVLVAHSYAGIPATQATRGLTRGEREQEGEAGGIVRLAYMCAIVVEQGMSSMTAGGEMELDFLEIGEDGYAAIADAAKCAQKVFSHVPLDKGIEYANTFSEHSIISFANELTHAGYVDVPTSFMFCEEDRVVTPADQQKGIERIEKASGRKVLVTRGKWDHCPTVSHLEDAVEWLVGLVEKGGSEN